MQKTTALSLARAFGYLSVSEVQTLKTLVSMVDKDRSVTLVNIGAGTGTSSLSIAESAIENGLSYTLYSVDINKHDNPYGGLANEQNAFRDAEVPLPVQLWGDSRDWASRWDNSKIDFIFIDDGHLEDEITGDIEGWFPHMAENSIMSYHDYGSPKWPAVQKVVSQKMRACNANKILAVDTLVGYRVKRK